MKNFERTHDKLCSLFGVMIKRFVCCMTVFIFLLCAVPLFACNNTPTDMETVTVYGEFYTLQQAFDKELLTEEQVKFIAQNEKTPEKFSAIDSADREKILHDYKQLHPAASDDLDVLSYGSYDGSCVVLVVDNYYGNAFSDTVKYGYYCVYNKKYRETVATYSFDFCFVRVWREREQPVEVEKPQTPSGAFFTYKRAFELGLFDKTDWDKREFVETEHTKPSDWEAVVDDIIHDYYLLEMDFDRDNGLGIYNPEAGFHSTEKFVPDVRFVGYLNGFCAVRVLTLYNADGFGDNYYTFEIAEGFTYEDRYPRGILWIPLEKLNEASNS